MLTLHVYVGRCVICCLPSLPCSADELLITEMLFNGVFNDLTSAQCCALLSVFVFQEKASEMPKLTEELSGPLRIMQVWGV